MLIGHGGMLLIVLWNKLLALLVLSAGLTFGFFYF